MLFTLAWAFPSPSPALDGGELWSKIRVTTRCLPPYHGGGLRGDLRPLIDGAPPTDVSSLQSNGAFPTPLRLLPTRYLTPQEGGAYAYSLRGITSEGVLAAPPYAPTCVGNFCPLMGHSAASAWAVAPVGRGRGWGKVGLRQRGGEGRERGAGGTTVSAPPAPPPQKPQSPRGFCVHS